MPLTPKGPPGRASRKALLYAREVQRLRSEGYSLEAIRLALRDVGVTVSLSTVCREAARRNANTSRGAVNDGQAQSAQQGGQVPESLNVAEAIEQLINGSREPLSGTAFGTHGNGEIERQDHCDPSSRSEFFALLQRLRRAG